MLSKVLSTKNIPRPNFEKSKIVKEKKTFTQYHQRPRVPSEKYHKKPRVPLNSMFSPAKPRDSRKPSFLISYSITNALLGS